MANLQASLQPVRNGSEPASANIAIGEPALLRKHGGDCVHHFIFPEYDHDSQCLRDDICGNPSALLLHNDSRVERVDSTASVAGLFLEFNCAMAERPLCPGDTLTLHADGVTECYSPSSENSVSSGAGPSASSPSKQKLWWLRWFTS